MKLQLHISLILLVVLGINTSKLNAQCVPDSTFAIYDLGVFPFPYNESPDNPNFPDSAYVGVTDTIFTGEPWEMTFTAVVPEEISFGGIPTGMEYVRVEGVSGIPPGLDYECSAVDCIYNPGLHCFLVSGTTWVPGAYNIVVNIQAKLDNIPEIPLQIPPDPANNPLNFPEGIYEAIVVSLTNVTEVAIAADLHNAYPNPVKDELTLAYNTYKSSDILLTIQNVNGQVVHSESLTSVEGFNSTSLNSAAWDSGIYIYQITDGFSAVNGKVIKE